MRVIPFAAEHLDLLDIQEGQQYLRKFLPLELRKALQGEYSYTALDGDRVIACAGLAPQWEGRAIAWAYLANDLGALAMMKVHQAVLRFLEVAPFDRIEATVDLEFGPGHRWMRMLGFTVEAPHMPKYRPDGGDSSLYARVR